MHDDPEQRSSKKIKNCHQYVYKAGKIKSLIQQSLKVCACSVCVYINVFSGINLRTMVRQLWFLFTFCFAANNNITIIK